MLTQTLLELKFLSNCCSKRGIGRLRLFLLFPGLPTLDFHFRKKQRRRNPKTNFLVFELLGIMLEH